MLSIDIFECIKNIENNNAIFDKKHNVGDSSFFIVRSLPNKDKIIFFEFNEELDIEINIPNINFQYELDKKYIKPNYDVRYGDIDISGWQTLLRSNDYEIILSKLYDYKKHTENNSYIYELISERKINLDGDRNSIKLNIHSSNEKSSFSLFLTKEKFFNSEHNLEQYLDLFYSELFKCNAACSTWYKYDALLTKLAHSIKPYNKKGYQVSIHHSSKKELVHFYRINKDRFIYNLLVNAAYTILNFQPSHNGMYLTTFTSDWLFQRYNIEAPYIDTRLNETFINTLEDIKKLTGQFLEYDIFGNYAKFLHKSISTVHRSKNGFFFPDYFSLDGKITHTSLNHQLGIANYLLSLYKKDKDPIILQTYHKIINFVIDTKDLWINNETGDLYYETNTDEIKKLTFKGKDYIYVTLSDLLFLLKNHKEEFGCIIKELVYLVNKKIEFLVKEGFDPELSNKIASGEGENDKKHIVRILKELGLYYFLELARKEDSYYLDTVNNLSDISLTREIPSAFLIYLKSKQAFELGDKCRADFFYRLNHILHSSSVPYTAKIGKNSLFAYGGIGVIIHGSAIIGERCNIGSGVTIGGDNNGIPVIGDDVFISTGAKILGAVNIGDGAIIGANTIVKKDVPPFTIVAGIPAKEIGIITKSNFKKYSGFYWCTNDKDKNNVFCDWYVQRNKMNL